MRIFIKYLRPVTQIAWAGQGLEIKVSTWKTCDILSGSYAIYMVCSSLYSSVGCSLFFPLCILSLKLPVHSANKLPLKLPWPDLYLRKCTCNKHNWIFSSHFYLWHYFFSSPFPGPSTFFPFLSSHKQNDMLTNKWLFLVSCFWGEKKVTTDQYDLLINTWLFQISSFHRQKYRQIQISCFHSTDSQLLFLFRPPWAGLIFEMFHCFSPIETIYLEIRNFLDQSSGIVSTTLYKPAVKSRSSEMTNSFFMVSPLCK